MFTRLPATQAILIVVAACALWLSGCTTPIEVKIASKKQLELIDSLDQATRNLESALAAFHQNNQVLIKNQGRVDIARQAIAVATKKHKTTKVSADELFDTYKNDVQPWIDLAFREPADAQEIGFLRAKIAGTSDQRLKLKLQQELQDLRVGNSILRRKPEPVAELEAVYQSELDKEAESIGSLGSSLKILRAQIASMQAMQTKVDAWLSIDVTVTQEQINQLTQSFQSAHQSLSGGGQ